MNDQTIKEKSGLATAALVLGIVGIVMSLIPIIRVVCYPLGILSLVFAVIPLCQKKSVAKAIVSIVLAVATLALTISLQAATTKAVSDALEDASNSLSDMTGENTESILKNDVNVEFGKFEIVKGNFIDEYKLPVTVKNISKEKASYTIKIEAVDSDGKRIEDDTIFVNDLNAGQTQDFKAFTLITSDVAKNLKNASFNIVEVSKF